MNFDLNVLEFFAGLRSPVPTAVMSVITYLGQEMLPVFFLCFIFWCVDKKIGYTLGFSYISAGILLQAIKITCRVERPWIRWKGFSPVESAVPGATGYSFPSGHTQSAVTLYGTVAFSTKKLWLKILMWTTAVLVAVSRVYLGVHTPTDVIAAFLLTAFLTYLSSRLAGVLYDGRKYDVAVLIAVGLFSLAVLIYAIVSVEFLSLPYKLGADCFKASGAGVAFAVGYFVERRHIDFDTRCRNVGIQALKLIIGVAVAIALKEIPKHMFPGNMISDTLRYFAAVVWALILYPMIIKKVFEPKKNSN